MYPRHNAALDRASALREAGRVHEALAAYRRLVKIQPDDADVKHHLGALLTQIGKLKEGEIWLRRAQTTTPDMPKIRHALSLNLMAQGRYAEAQPYYTARHALPELPIGRRYRFPFKPWQGEGLAGKHLAIFPEGGYGDQIQFARFAPVLVSNGADVTMLTRPALVRLFRDSLEGVDIVEASGAVNFPDPDYWVATADIIGTMGLTGQMVPGAPYLRARRATTGPMRHIGVKLQGNPAFANDAKRSLTPAAASDLLSCLPSDVTSLEPEDTGATDFADTAAIIAGLDAVVSVDTSVAHLAGALGRPCFTLLPGFATDWRWMQEGRVSRWYSSMRLYRGTIAGDWGPAIRLLTEDLNAVLR